MEELTKILLKIDSSGAVDVANKYISYKYTELFCCIGLIGMFIFAIVAVAGLFIYKSR